MAFVGHMGYITSNLPDRSWLNYALEHYLTELLATSCPVSAMKGVSRGRSSWAIGSTTCCEPTGAKCGSRPWVMPQDMKK